MGSACALSDAFFFLFYFSYLVGCCYCRWITSLWVQPSQMLNFTFVKCLEHWACGIFKIKFIIEKWQHHKYPTKSPCHTSCLCIKCLAIRTTENYSMFCFFFSAHFVAIFVFVGATTQRRGGQHWMVEMLCTGTKNMVDLSRRENAIICMQVTAHFHLIMFYHLGFWLYPSSSSSSSSLSSQHLHSRRHHHHVTPALFIQNDDQKQIGQRCDVNNKKNWFKIMFPDQNRCSSFCDLIQHWFFPEYVCV